MATEHYVAEVAEIPEGGRLIVTIKGREIGIFHIKGNFYALLNYCFHQGGPLCAGFLDGTFVSGRDTNWKPQWVQEGEILICPWHYTEFDITTGRNLAFPNRRAQTYPLRVEAGKLYLGL